MEIGSNSTKQLITQFILIVFSVVLGLYLSERIEDGKKRKESKELLTTIESELKDNIRLLNKWVPYHHEVSKRLDSLSKDETFKETFMRDKFAALYQLLTEGTFMGRRPASDAWDIAKSHPLIVNIEHQKLVALSRIYNQQEMTFDPGMEMINLIKSKGVNAPENVEENLVLMSNHMDELVAREKQLVYYYRQAKEILDLDDERGEEE
ncbi:MAG: hypothetical protein AAFV25_20425 [Bacteroidota bacterium]